MSLWLKSSQSFFFEIFVSASCFFICVFDIYLLFVIIKLENGNARFIRETNSLSSIMNSLLV
jgi:fumarate reductase subunit C